VVGVDVGVEDVGDLPAAALGEFKIDSGSTEASITSTSSPDPTT
jgi:hypothetical protein